MRRGGAANVGTWGRSQTTFPAPVQFSEQPGAAARADPITDNGQVVLFDVRAAAPKVLGSIEVGPHPDNLMFTPDGKRILVANEGQPNDLYTVDPEGSISIIDAERVLEEGVAAADQPTLPASDTAFAEYDGGLGK